MSKIFGRLSLFTLLICTLTARASGANYTNFDYSKKIDHFRRSIGINGPVSCAELESEINNAIKVFADQNGLTAEIFSVVGVYTAMRVPSGRGSTVMNGVCDLDFTSENPAYAFWYLETKEQKQKPAAGKCDADFRALHEMSGTLISWLDGGFFSCSVDLIALLKDGKVPISQSE